jgi:DNA-binding transcriptional ArsR family regulator
MQLRIISDPVRLQMILALKSGEMIAGQLAEILGTDAATIEEQSTVLFATKLLDAKKRHGRIHYSLRPGVLRFENDAMVIELPGIRITIPGLPINSPACP